MLRYSSGVSTSNASRSLAAIVGANVRTARTAKDLTQHELAVALGSGDAMTVSRWERGTHIPSVERLVRLAEVLDRDVAWFYSPPIEKRAA